MMGAARHCKPCAAYPREIPVMAAHDALRTILPVAGLDPERARTVEITGGADPVLPTSFKIAETSAACLGAIGLAVCDLWELRGGKQQGIAVDVRRATASLRSEIGRASCRERV